MLLGVPVSAGWVDKAAARVSAQLGKAGFDDAMTAALAAEDVLAADETPVNVLVKNAPQAAARDEEEADPEEKEKPAAGAPHVLIVLDEQLRRAGRQSVTRPSPATGTPRPPSAAGAASAATSTPRPTTASPRSTPSPPPWPASPGYRPRSPPPRSRPDNLRSQPREWTRAWSHGVLLRTGEFCSSQSVLAAPAR
jgi:hypothetical protein